jgi:hypothetical protein
MILSMIYAKNSCRRREGPWSTPPIISCFLLQAQMQAIPHPLSWHKMACDGLSHVRHFPIWPQLALKMRCIDRRRLLICIRHEFDLNILQFWLLFTASHAHALLIASDKMACASHFGQDDQGHFPHISRTLRSPQLPKYISDISSAD